MDLNVLGTSSGLALASGVNAYVPLLCLALFRGPMPPQYAWVQNPLFVILLILLALLDIVFDKIPVLDTFWDSIHTVIRPVMGALVAFVNVSISGATTSTQFPHVGIVMAATASSAVLPLLPVLGGGVLAGAGHTTKAVGRLTVAFGSFGCFNTVISALEDVIMGVVILISFVNPVVMLVIVGCIVLVLLFFSPVIIEALKYNIRIFFSLFRSTVFPIFFLDGGGNTANVFLSLSEEEREQLHTILPPSETPRASVRLLWLRKLNKKGPWGRRKIAPPTWLIVLQDKLMFYPPSRPELAKEIDLADIKSPHLRRNIFMGWLQIQTDDGHVYAFTVLRDVLDTTIDFVRTYFPNPVDVSDRKDNNPTEI